MECEDPYCELGIDWNTVCPPEVPYCSVHVTKHLDGSHGLSKR